MKKSIIIAFVILSTLFFSCKKAPSNSPEEAKLENTVSTTGASESANKEVELTQAQYNAAEIKTGQIEQKNLSDVIRVNGNTELPAQSQAEVSSFLSGTITAIYVNLGDYVKKGQTLGLIDSPEYIQLREEYSISKNNLDYLELEFKRQQTLRAENINSEKTFQKVKSDLNIERARFQSLSNRMSLVQSGSGSKSLKIVSPISGNIATIPIKIGTNVMAGQSLFTLVDNTQLHLDLLVYEKDLPFIKVGQKVSFAFANINTAEVGATIFSISKSFEPNSKTVRVHATIDETTETLIPGLYVNALIHIGEKTVDALPTEAIVKADGREFVFILEDVEQEKEGTTYHFQRLEVKTGVAELGYTQVTLLQPINPSAKIVTSGAYYVQSHLTKTDGGSPEHGH